MNPQTTDGQWGTRRMHARFILPPSARVPSPPPLSPPAALSAAQKPKLLDQVRHAIRFRHYSYRTEKTYIHWIKRFIFFHQVRHPSTMGKAEVE
jgi:hypothetical protein